MQKSLLLCFCLAAIILAGCQNYLLYRQDFEDDKIAYYTRTLETEDKIQQESIATINQKLTNLLELCYVLYHRLPTKSNRFDILEVNLKLGRLRNSIDTLEDMRKKFYQGFRLIFSREDFVVGPLQLQAALEVQYMSKFTNLLNELRARILYMERFRKESLLTTDLLEEKLEGADADIFRLNKELSDIICRDVADYLRNVGIAITRDEKFNFEFTQPAEFKREADKEAESALLAAGKKELLDNVSDYYYEFESERKEFSEAYKKLKDSIDRFQQAIVAFKEHASKKQTNKDDVQLAEQSRQITSIMEEMAESTKNLYEEAMGDVNKILGVNLKEVDETLWPQLKAETDEAAKVNNFESYKNNVIELSADLEQALSLDQPNSEAQRLHKHLHDLGKSFQEKQGIWGPGYARLSPEWQEKISSARLEDALMAKLKELEGQAIQAIRPLWKTCTANLAKQGKEPEYQGGAKGFLVPKAK